MKKFFTTLSLVAFLAVATVGCSGSSASTDSSGPSEAKCAEWGDELLSAFKEYHALISLVSTQSEINAAVKTGRTAIIAGRAFVSSCGHYNPAEAQETLDGLDEFEDTLDRF